MNILRTLLILSVLLCSSGAAWAQKDALLQGEWVYQEPIGKADMDEKTMQMMDSFFGEMTFRYGADGDYDMSAMGKAESGKWAMDGKGTKVTLTPEKGPQSEIKVISVTTEQWLMEIAEGKGFVMARKPAAKE